MTPNIGQGATTAVESAASLSNGLHELIKASGAQTPSERQISEMLHNFSRKQRQRMETFYEISGFVARYHALDRLAHWVIARYVTPHTGDFIAASIGWGATEGTVLDYIPLPREDWPTLAWWQRLGVKRTMSLSRTVVIGIALLILHILTYQLICFVYPSF
jgi:FAD dependent monooxygenase